MNKLASLADHKDKHRARQTGTVEDLRAGLARISQSLYADTSLDSAEAAIDEVGRLFDMNWVWWTPDCSHPYHCPRAQKFSREHGWPAEIMDLWQQNRLMLHSPFHIRSRFENLPFVTQPDTRDIHHGLPGYSRLNHLIAGLGVNALLHVPVHLPKGRIGLVNWGGKQPPEDVRAVLPEVTGELLAIGHLFMRNYDAEIGQDHSVDEEKARLTLREWDCLRLLAQGYREAEAAELLGISKSTLRFHVENVVRKFGCKNRTQAVAMAAQLGLLGPIGS